MNCQRRTANCPIERGYSLRLPIVTIFVLPTLPLLHGSGNVHLAKIVAQLPNQAKRFILVVRGCIRNFTTRKSSNFLFK